jgi:hypothetical protein
MHIIIAHWFTSWKVANLADISATTNLQTDANVNLHKMSVLIRVNLTEIINSRYRKGWP